MTTKLMLQTLLSRENLSATAWGSRSRAAEVRQTIEAALEVSEAVELDFDGIEATQSFVDELVGLVVLQRGPSALTRISFKKCSPTMKSIIRFVLTDRARQFEEQQKLAINMPRMHRQRGALAVT